MDVEPYLKRINYDMSLEKGVATLAQLHQAHIFSVPFEDLDIHLGIPISLEPQAIYRKVVHRCRGGFCYELNALFHQLLRQLGYDAITINAQIIHEGQPGPRYDHMAIAVKLDDTDWLVDVGYGDLFITPIAITPDLVQFDGFNYFMVKPLDSQTYCLWMSKDQMSFEEKYIFQLKQEPIINFRGLCEQKQHSATSYFVQNLICTKPTLSGRKTVFNNQLTIREGAQKTTYSLKDKAALLDVLDGEFAIHLFADQEKLLAGHDLIKLPAKQKNDKSLYVMKQIDKLAWIEIDDNRILLTKSFGKDKFYIPGGKRELGETDSQALSREIREELSVTVDTGSLTFMGIFEAQAHGQPEGVLVKMSCYSGEYTGELRASAEIEAIRWFSYAEKDQVVGVDQIIFDHLKQHELLA